MKRFLNPLTLQLILPRPQMFDLKRSRGDTTTKEERPETGSRHLVTVMARAWSEILLRTIGGERSFSWQGKTVAAKKEGKIKPRPERRNPSHWISSFSLFFADVDKGLVLISSQPHDQHLYPSFFPGRQKFSSFFWSAANFSQLKSRGVKVKVSRFDTRPQFRKVLPFSREKKKRNQKNIFLLRCTENGCQSKK